MRLAHPIENLAKSLYDAAYCSLPEFSYESREWNAEKHLSIQERTRARQEGVPFPTKMVTRRPDADECVVVAMFAQTWGSTALGFGGFGGAAITAAYPVVIQGPTRHQAVYWAGNFAYLIDPAQQSTEQATAWSEDLLKSYTASRKEAVARYGALLPTAAAVE